MTVVESLRILIVEDDWDTAESMFILLGLHGYSSQFCSDGKEAIQMATAGAFDVVLLDLGLPGPMDGWDVARHLRELSGDKRALLIAVSGYADAKARQKSDEAGIDLHFSKPVHIRSLLKILGRFAAVVGPTPAAAVSFATFYLDPEHFPANASACV